MPKEEKFELVSNGKFVKDMYIDSKVVDKFWIKGSNYDHGKPATGTLGTLILNDCIAVSNGSHEISFDDEPITRSMFIREEFNPDDFEARFSQVADKEADVTNSMASSIRESKSLGSDEDDKLQDHENQNLISSKNAAHGEIEESMNIIEQYAETLPYSGSISLRSTSSAQSFAFPILAQEWSSSPVAMAKPDKRMLRKQKQKQWKMKFSQICCRF